MSYSELDTIVSTLENLANDAARVKESLNDELLDLSGGSLSNLKAKMQSSETDIRNAIREIRNLKTQLMDIENKVKNGGQFMIYVKANKARLQDLINEQNELSSNLESVIGRIHSFKSTQSSSASGWNNGQYTSKHYVAPNPDRYKDKDGKLKNSYYQAKAQATSVANAKVANYVSSYKTALSSFPDLSLASKNVNATLESLKGVFELIKNFESMATETDNLDLEKVAESLGDNYSVETITVNVDGEEQQVQVLMYTDEDGQQYTVSELVNAFYTYTGVTANNAVVLASKGLNDEELETELAGMVVSTALGVDNQLQRGFYSVASRAGIETMYSDVMGKEYEETVVNQEYASILGEHHIDSAEYEEALSGVTNASKFGGMAMAGALMAGLNFKMVAPEEEKDEEEEKKPQVQGGAREGGRVADTLEGEGTSVTEEVPSVGGGSKVEVTVEEVDPALVNEEENEEPEPELPPEENIEMIDEVIPEEPELPPEEEIDDTEVLEPEETEPPEVLEPEEPELVVGDREAREIRETMYGMDREATLENVTREPVTSEDIDSQARDQYYSDTERVIENRLNNYNRYDGMTLEEKVQALESVGYDHETASILVQDNAKGQTAYIVGLEEQDLAKLSNEIAKSEGISELEHDTRFDDGHNLDYVESGNANVDMSLIPQNVQVARKELTEAKYAYDDAVTVANNAINRAKVIKEDYYNIVEAIKTESGSDPKYWTEAQVNEYNRAVNNYNDAAQEANRVTTIVQEKKAIYEQEKLEYRTTYEEYRKTALETIGESLRVKDEVLDEGLQPSDGPVVDVTPTISADGTITIGKASSEFVRPPDAEIIPVVPKEEIK